MDLLENWIQLSFDEYSGGKQYLTRHSMKLAVLSLIGRPIPLPKEKNEFSFKDLKSVVITSRISDILKDTREIYSMFDPEANGYLKVENLIDRNNLFSSIQIKEAFDSVDTDHDGLISYREFVQCIRLGFRNIGIPVDC